MFCLESGVAVAPACEEQRLDEGGLRPLGDGLDELEDRLGDPVVLSKHVEEPPCRKGEREWNTSCNLLLLLLTLTLLEYGVFGPFFPRFTLLKKEQINM